MKIHPTAIVDPGARIAPDVEIGPFCTVGADVEIGPGSRLLSRVIIIGRVRIGARNVFHPTCVVGGPPQDERPAAPDASIQIGDDNIFREAVTINQPKVPGNQTRIGSRNRFHFASHAAHDVHLGNDVTMAMFSLLGGHVVVEDHVYLEPHVAIHQFVTIGRWCFLRHHSAISEDAAPFLRFEGPHNHPAGVNRTMLTRAGFPEKTLAALEEAYHIVWDSGLPRPESIAILQARPEPEVKEFAEHVRRAADGRMGRYEEAHRR